MNRADTRIAAMVTEDLTLPPRSGLAEHTQLRSRQIAENHEDCRQDVHLYKYK